LALASAARRSGAMWGNTAASGRIQSFRLNRRFRTELMRGWTVLGAHFFSGLIPASPLRALKPTCRNQNPIVVAAIVFNNRARKSDDYLFTKFGFPITLSISCGYVARLLRNTRVERHLEKHHPDILAELRSLLSEVKPGRTKEALAS
jgi:hypothetical protein